MRPYLRVANVHEARIDLSSVLEMNFEPEEAERFLLRSGDVLLNEGQSYQHVGRPAIYRGEVPGACFQNTLIRFRPRELVSSEFALTIFRAYMRTGRFRREAQQTTNIAHLSLGRLAEIEFPLPPLAEQKRIVAKVDQLMALCDDLEARQTKKHELGTRLTKSALEALTSAEGAEEFDAAWRRVVENFGTLFQDIRSLEILRTLVFQLAIRGSISASSRALDKTGPRALPPSWEWRRVDEVGEAKLGKMRSPEFHQGTHMRKYLRVANVLEGRIDASDLKEMNFTPAEAERYSLRPGDILLNEGQSVEFVGRPAIYRGESPGACFQKTLIRFRCRPTVIPEFALIVFRAYMRTGRFQGAAVQTTNMAHLPLMRLVGIEFPLPPIQEQRSIVAKVDDLMKLCDQLEANLKRAEDKAARLVEAVVQELVA
jgi:type I restriction enzyme S subunit